MIDRVRLLFGLKFNFIALSRLIPAKSAFHKKGGRGVERQSAIGYTPAR